MNSTPIVVDSFCPRISDAVRLLPLLRQCIVAASSTHALPPGVSVELTPIVEDGLFGFEFVPALPADTFLIVGCDSAGAPMLRKTRYDSEAGNALQLVAVDGRTLPQAERKPHPLPQQFDRRYADLPSVAEAAWGDLVTLFPGGQRHPVTISQNRQRALEEALSIAHAHLARWDPAIQFFGLPSEAEQGFALRGANDDFGELVFQRPDIWILRWKAPPDAVYESWSVALPDLDAAQESAGGGHIAS